MLAPLVSFRRVPWPQSLTQLVWMLSMFGAAAAGHRVNGTALVLGRTGCGLAFRVGRGALVHERSPATP